MDLEEDMITLNIGGTIFQTSAHTCTLFSVKNSRLAKLAKRHLRCNPNQAGRNEYLGMGSKIYSFDRSPVIFEAILDFYRYGVLHNAPHICKQALETDLRFWEIPGQAVSFCCQQEKDSDKGEVLLRKNLLRKFEEGELGCAPPPEDASYWKKVQYNVYATLEKPFNSIPGKVYGVVSVLAAFLPILLSITASVENFGRVAKNENTTKAILQSANLTNPKEILMLTTVVRPVIQFLDYASVVFFVLDIVLRFVFCPNKKVFFKTSYNLIDIVCLVLHTTMTIMHGLMSEMDVSNVPFIQEISSFMLLISVGYTLRLSRIIVFCTRDILIVKVLMLSLLESSKVLLLMIAMMSFFTLVFGPLAYLADFYIPDKFPDIPIACWWAIVTMTTVGYGDQYPGSLLGYIVGSLCALTGLVLTALPIAVIGNNFNELYNFMKMKEEAECPQMNTEGNNIPRNIPLENSRSCITLNSKTEMKTFETENDK